MRHDLIALTGDIAVGDLPTDCTLRIAKALGYAAVLHHRADFGWPDPAETEALRKRVAAARLAYESTATVQSGPEGLPKPAQLAALIGGLPKPLLVVSRDSASLEGLADIALTRMNAAAVGGRVGMHDSATDPAAIDTGQRKRRVA